MGWSDSCGQRVYYLRFYFVSFRFILCCFILFYAGLSVSLNVADVRLLLLLLLYKLFWPRSQKSVFVIAFTRLTSSQISCGFGLAVLRLRFVSQLKWNLARWNDILGTTLN